MVKIEPQSAVASFDVDAQYGFTPCCPNELPVPNAEEIVPELNRQAQFAKYRLGSKDAHSPAAIWVTHDLSQILTPVHGDNVDVRWPVHCVPGTKGFELIKGLPHPAQYDYFVFKGVEPDMHPYGGCYHDLSEKLSTGAIEFLRYHDVTTVIVGGLATDYCVKNTALQLCQAGFQVIVNLGACRGLSPDSTQQALTELQLAGVTIIQTANELEQTSVIKEITHV